MAQAHAATDATVGNTSYPENITEADADNYRLGPDDIVSITVDSVDEISRQYTVSETGNIVFPTLLSPLKAQGLTIEELRKLVINALTEYMYEPKVTVDIVEFKSHKVLVLGPFQKPGKYELRREMVPLLDVIMEAGGVRELDESDELVVLRNHHSSNSALHDPESLELMKPIRVNLQALLRDGDLTQNVMVQSGDVIYLTSFFASERYVYVAGGGGRGAGALPYEQGLTAFTNCHIQPAGK